MRRLAIITVFMVALLPLRWFTVVATPVGTLYLHEVGLLVLSVVALATIRIRVFAVALQSTVGFMAAMTAGFAVWGAACVFSSVTISPVVKQVAYLGSFVVVVAVLILIAESLDMVGIRVLRWAGVVTTVTLVAALGFALTFNHVDAVSLFTRAVSSGDPTVVEAQLFRPAFAGFGYSETDAVSQLRHEVFAGLLVSLLVASWAQHLMPFQRRSARWLSQAGVIVAGLLVVLSLSRAIQLAALAWPLLAGLRVLVRAQVTRRQLVSLGVVSLVGILVAASGFLGVVMQRVTQDSSSYDERGAKFNAAIDTIGRYPWAGGHYEDAISAHNFVIDAWLRGGVVMAVLMLTALVIVVWRMVANMVRIGSAPAWVVVATAAFALPLVRMFTIGAGLLSPPEWVCLAFGFAASAVYQRQRAAARLALRRGTGPRADVDVSQLATR